MRNQTFKFKIDGKGVSPKTVSARDLFDLIFNLESAFATTAKDSGAKDHDDLQISIVEISAGSDELTLAVSDRMFKAAAKVSNAIASNDFSKIPMQVHGRLRDLWKKAKSTNWTLRFCQNGNGIADASIAPDNEILKPGAIDGPTTLYGFVERVGGSERQTLQILLLSGERHTIGIKTKELAQQIAAHLHTIVGIEGDATWDIATWKLSEFKATAVVEYKDTSLPDAFESLAAVSGGHWDDVNADEYVGEFRSD